MPFHSTRTEEEALDLVFLHCRLDYEGNYRIDKTWPGQDIMAAMASARRQFNLSEGDS
jgi:hypothetical protein